MGQVRCLPRLDMMSVPPVIPGVPSPPTPHTPVSGANQVTMLRRFLSCSLKKFMPRWRPANSTSSLSTLLLCFLVQNRSTMDLQGLHQVRFHNS